MSTEDLVLGFANTHGHLGRLPERFADIAGLRDWLSQQKVDSKVLVITAADVIEAREIRDASRPVFVRGRNYFQDRDEPMFADMANGQSAPPGPCNGPHGLLALDPGRRIRQGQASRRRCGRKRLADGGAGVQRQQVWNGRAGVLFR